MTHLLGHERKGMWYLDVVIEILVFAYAYLNMFTLLSQYIYPESFLSNYQITRVEVGLFVSSDIVTSVSKGDFFFYLLPFFIRIVIAASRILSLNVFFYELFNLMFRRRRNKKKLNLKKRN